MSSNVWGISGYAVRENVCTIIIRDHFCFFSTGTTVCVLCVTCLCTCVSLCVRLYICVYICMCVCVYCVYL